MKEMFECMVSQRIESVGTRLACFSHNVHVPSVHVHRHATVKQLRRVTVCECDYAKQLTLWREKARVRKKQTQSSETAKQQKARRREKVRAKRAQTQRSESVHQYQSRMPRPSNSAENHCSCMFSLK